MDSTEERTAVVKRAVAAAAKAHPKHELCGVLKSSYPNFVTIFIACNSVVVDKKQRKRLERHDKALERIFDADPTLRSKLYSYIVQVITLTRKEYIRNQKIWEGQQELADPAQPRKEYLSFEVLHRPQVQTAIDDFFLAVDDEDDAESLPGLPDDDSDEFDVGDYEKTFDEYDDVEA